MPPPAYCQIDITKPVVTAVLMTFLSEIPTFGKIGASFFDHLERFGGILQARVGVCFRIDIHLPTGGSEDFKRSLRPPTH